MFLTGRIEVGVVLALAALTRETTLAVPAAIAAVWIRDRMSPSQARTSPQPGPVAIMIPFAVAAVWQWTLSLRWNQLPVLTGTGLIGPPLVGIADAARTELGAGRVDGAVTLALLGGGLFFVVLAFASLATSTALDHEKLAFMFFAVVTICLQASVWADLAGFLRVLAEVLTLGTFVVISSRSRAADAALVVLVCTSAMAYGLHTVFL